MAELVKINQVNNLRNKNVLNKFSEFNQPFTWNIATGTASAENYDSDQLYGKSCLRIIPDATVDCVVNSGGNENEINISEDGDYVFSIAYKFTNSGDNFVYVDVIIYINSVPTGYRIEIDTTINTPNEYSIFAQRINGLAVDDVIDFAFKINAGTTANVIRHFFDCMKFEKVNFENSMPSIYTSYEPIEINESQIIDVPSISSNSYETVVATVTGAIVSDFVQMTYPNELITLGAVVSVPIVTDNDEVSFLIHNHTGGAINPDSGVYTFKIIR